MGHAPYALVFFFFVFICSLGGIVWFSGLTADKPPSSPPMPTQTGMAPFEMAAGITPHVISDEVSTLPTVVDTLPPIPTVSHTPEPIVISDNRTFTPVIRYETRIDVQKVTQIVTVIHTRVPENTPNAYATQQADLHKQTIADRKLDRAWGWLGLIVVGTLFLAFVIFAIVNVVRDIWQKYEIKKQRVEQTAEEITTDRSHSLYPSIKARVLYLWDQGETSITAIVRDLEPDNQSGGGQMFYIVKDVLAQNGRITDSPTRPRD